MMTAKDATNKPLSMAIKIIICFHLVSTGLWLVGQTLVIIWLVASSRLQTPAATTENAMLQYDRAISITDTFILIPLHAMSTYGLSHREFYSIICSWIALALSMYWPTIFYLDKAHACHQRLANTSTNAFGQPVIIIFIAFNIWGSWYVCRNKELILWWETDF